MTKLQININIAVLCLAALVGCSPTNEANQNNPTSPVDSKSVSVTDAAGNRITLAEPANRIIALAPHIVENLYSIGAGEKIVGVMAYSNYPEAANSIPLVGGYASINIEKIIELEPDLIIAWQFGNASDSVSRLRGLGFKVYLDQPNSITDIAASFRNFGILTGRGKQAEKAATEFSQRLDRLRREVANKSPVRTFYQVWNDPLQTINGTHIISDAIELCGGVNIYADEPMIAPVINIESILERDPQAIIASGMSSGRPDWLDDWQQWSSLSAVKRNTIFFVNPDHIQRHTARILLGIDTLCQQLEVARSATK